MLRPTSTQQMPGSGATHPPDAIQCLAKEDSLFESVHTVTPPGRMQEFFGRTTWSWVGMAKHNYWINYWRLIADGSDLRVWCNQWRIALCADLEK